MTKKYEFTANKSESAAVAVQTAKPALTIQKLVASDAIIKSAEQTLGNKGQQFLTSVLALANSNADIARCEPMTTYNACLTAATLDLPINQNLGFAYIVPFKNNKKGGIYEAQFQMGYKGFIQLAIRSGKFESMNVREVRKDELLGVDEFSGEPKFKFVLGSTEKNRWLYGLFQAYERFRQSSLYDNRRTRSSRQEIFTKLQKWLWRMERQLRKYGSKNRAEAFA